MRRLVALLTASGECGKLFAALRGVEGELAGRVQRPDIRLRVGVQLDQDPIVEAARETGRDVGIINAVLQVESESADDAALMAILQGLDQWLGDTVCHERSAVVIGDCHEITTTVGEVVVAVASRRKPGLTLQQMHDHWLYKHAPMAVEMMGEERNKIGYDQLHVDPAASEQASQRCGIPYREIDALLQVWCREPEDYLAIETNPEFAARIYEDDLKFTDMDSMEGASLRTWRL